MRTHKHTYLHR